MGPTPSDVHVNRPITDMSVAWLQTQTNFVHAKIFPKLPVTKQSDLYFKFPRGAFNRPQMKPRAPGSPAARMSYEHETAQYRCESFGLEIPITDEARKNQDSPLNLDRQAGQILTLQSRLNREKRFAEKYFKAGVWDTNWTGVAASPGGNQILQWNDDASTPIQDIRKLKTMMHIKAGGFAPNKILFGKQAYDAVVDHPEIVERINRGQTPGGPATANAAALAAIFEVDEVHVADAVENAAAEGLAESSSLIFGKGVMMVYAPPAPGLMIPSAGYTFNWTEMGGNDEGMAIKSARDPQPSANTDLFWIEDYFSQEVIAADCGAFIASAVA